MLQKPKNWLAETLWKPKKTHSLEQLRYLHYTLQRNSTVNEGNKSLLVETLRQMAEILIWGDQNDSTVFDFFLEKNMLLFFLKFMTQNCGSYVTVQLLQTLNILFENIRHETSLYFLLSNNHVNSIIVHKFDFSNEEVLAYYISFLKTLSFKLNMQTINFFFNERNSDFPLYTEAIKFFHHSESMVRIAVRTLTLNTYKVGHEKMLGFICDKTATPYFSNLIWLIGKDAIELDDCVKQETDHFKLDKLKAAVADHLDHLHYLNDILSLKINMLNMILTDHMINRLLIPLYIYSLPDERSNNERVHISKLVSLFLISQHLLIMSHTPLVNAIVDVTFNETTFRKMAYTTITGDGDTRSLLSNTSSSSRAFIPPPASLESQLEAHGVTKDSYNLSLKLKSLAVTNPEQSPRQAKRPASTFYLTDNDGTVLEVTSSSISNMRQNSESEDTDSCKEEGDDLIDLARKADDDNEIKKNEEESNEKQEKLNKSEKEKQEKVNKQQEKANKKQELKSKSEASKPIASSTVDEENSLFPNDSNEEEEDVCQGTEKVFLTSILASLDCVGEDDSETFFALCLLYALVTNKGLDARLLKEIGLASPQKCEHYNPLVMTKLLTCLEQGVRDGSKMRLVTFDMCIKVIRLLVIHENIIRISDEHFAMLQNIREESTLQLRSFYKGDELFVETFEGQYHHMKAKPLNVQYITMDASLLLPATVTPLTGIDFIKRLPCGDAERTQRAAYIFILLRELSLQMNREAESYLPLSKIDNPVSQSQVLDLNNSDLIACTIVQQGKQNMRRFLVIDTSQFILVEPDTSKLGWGVVKFVSHLQDVEANPDKDDSRSLHIVIQQPFSRRSKSGFNPLPIMTCKFVFDDYIRCMSARQRLQKRCEALRHRKMSSMACLLELPALASPVASYYNLTTVDGQNSVWSPSSRDYKRKTSSNTSLSSNSSSLNVPASSASKTKVLSPKHEEILRQNRADDTRTPPQRQRAAIKKAPTVSMTPSTVVIPIITPPPSASKKTRPAKEAESLAHLLKRAPSPEEIPAEVESRRRTSTMEVGEEQSEDTVTLASNDSSYVLLNNSVSVERSSSDKQNLAKKLQQYAQNKDNISTTPKSSDLLNIRSASFDKTRCISAPGSPRGTRQRTTAPMTSSDDAAASSSTTPLLSKSLPSNIHLAASPKLIEESERKLRAQRARAKAKTRKTLHRSGANPRKAKNGSLKLI